MIDAFAPVLVVSGFLGFAYAVILLSEIHAISTHTRRTAEAAERAAAWAEWWAKRQGGG